MSLRNLFLVAAVVTAVLYFWPSQSVKVAKKIGDVTHSVVKSGVEEAKK